MLPGLAPGMSIAVARRAVAQAFRDGGLDSPDLDARLLVGHALGLDHTALASSGERELTADEASVISNLATRRLAHEPVARIIGRKEFWALEFSVTPATLVPRPDTETLVEAALAAIPDRSLALRIADFGTGTGALCSRYCRSIQMPLGSAPTSAVSALAVARDNATRLGVGRACIFCRLRLWLGLARTVRSHHFQSALYRQRRNCRTGSGSSRLRSAGCARRRQWRP